MRRHHLLNCFDEPFAHPPREAAPRVGDSVHCSILAVDVAGFGRRDEEAQQHVRDAMYVIVERALKRSGIAWGDCHVEDRGDGLMVVPPARVHPVALVDPLLHFLGAGLRRHNKLHSAAATIRLRAALHTGRITFDRHGVSGATVVHVFRLLDAPAMKEALAGSGADLAFLASAEVYDTHLRHGPELVDPDSYRPVEVRVKETVTRAWLHVPAVAAAPAALGRAAAAPALPDRLLRPVPPLEPGPYGDR